VRPRVFIRLLGGAAAAVHGAGAAWSPFVASFVRRLGELGWIEGERSRSNTVGRTKRTFRRDRGRVCSA
jgi:hypothetical protein